MEEQLRAGLGRRTAAFLIDCAILLIPLLITTIIVGALAGSTEAGTTGGWVMLGLLVLEMVAYFTAFEGRSGQTPGKRLLGLRVTSLSGGPVGLKGALIRNLLRVVDAQPGGFFLVGAAMVVAMPQRQRLGDLAAKSAVVRVAPAAESSTEAALALE